MFYLRQFRYTMVVCGLFVLAGGVFVAIRLATLNQHGGLTWGTLWPLVAAALTTVFESVLILVAPAGLGLEIGSATRSRSPQSAGSSVGSVSRRDLLWIACLWFIGASAAGALANVRWGAPGPVVRGVLLGARAACEAHDGRTSSPVPMLKASWHCLPNGAPRLEGELSKNGAIVHYSASDLEVSDDLAYVDLNTLEVSLQATPSRPSLRIAVGDARLRGAWPWAKTKRLSGAARACFVSALSSLLGLVAMVLVRTRRPGVRWPAPVAALIGSCVAWLLLSFIDGHLTLGAASYAGIPIVAVAAMTVAWLLLQDPRLGRVLAALRGRTLRHPQRR